MRFAATAPALLAAASHFCRRPIFLANDRPIPVMNVPIMKYLPTVAGILLGLLFIMSSVVVLFHLVQMPPPPAGTPAAMFMGAFGPTGYMTFVKVLELTGGILVAIPATRNFGLLVLGPIIVNILAFHVFIAKGEGLFDPMLIVIVLLALYLLWAGRKAFAGLLR
jgi:uncharacterized membrane protein YphA (DoxX/SURF4 family)